MKRCPECSFIYEDEQHSCDMDGKTLVHDVGPVPDQFETGPDELPVTSRSRRLATQAIAGILLVAILFAVYYLLTRPQTPLPKPSPAPMAHQSSSKSTRPEEYPPASVLDLQPDKPAPTANVSTSVAETKAAKPEAKTNSTKKEPDPRLTISRSLPPLRTIPPLRRLPAAKPEVKKSNRIETPPAVVATPAPAKASSKTVTVTNKKESKLGSFLKRTGRVLAKPFKF